MKKIVCTVMVLLLSLSVFSGCGKSKLSNQKGNTLTGTISSDSTKVGGNGVFLEVSSVCLDDKAEYSITPQKNLPLVGKISVDSYNFRIETQEELVGIMKITIPYNENELGKNMKPEENVCAAYYNESTGKWESVIFKVNKEEKNITITTNHLSIYGVFVISKEYTRDAYIEYVSPKTAMNSEAVASKYAEVINEAIGQNMTPGPSALELGNTFVGNWFNFQGSITTLSSQIYPVDFLDNMGKAMTNLGLLTAVAQAAVDYSNGNEVAMNGNLIKNLSNFAVSKWGSNMLQLGFVGVFALDYALNEFANAAITGRKDIYSEAYRLYYMKEAKAKRTAKDGYKIMLSIAKESKSPLEMDSKVMAEIDEYCKQFWKDETMVAFYQSEAQKTGFSGLGGLNLAVEKEISDSYKYVLLQSTLQPVFTQITRKLALEQEQKVYEELMKIAKELNKVVSVRVFDSIYEETEEGERLEKSPYSGCTVKFDILSDKITDSDQWEAVIDEKGRANIEFTLIAHILAGSPKTIEVVSQKDDKVLKKIEFIIEMPETIVDTADNSGIKRLNFIGGTESALLGFGINAALREVGSIQVGSNGKFSTTVPFATINVPAENSKNGFDVQVNNLILDGSWDKKTKTGTFNLSCVVGSTRLDKVPIENYMDYDEAYYRTTYEYTDVATGSGIITLEGDRLVFDLKSNYNRTGSKKLVRVIVDEGETKVGDNPTITNKNGSYSFSGKYNFSIK
jgi:hypothetical protein